jgi:hypothetical protein
MAQYPLGADRGPDMMNAVTLPFLVVGAALTALLYVFGLRRLLGLHLPLRRTLIAGVIAFLIASPIIIAIIPQTPNILPDLWFVILGTVIAFLVGMTLLVVAEMFVPSGSMPGLLYLARELHKSLGRTKRYLQIVSILVRRGLPPTSGVDAGPSFELRRVAPIWLARFAWRSKRAASPSSSSVRSSPPGATCCPTSLSKS